MENRIQNARIAELAQNRPIGPVNAPLIGGNEFQGLLQDRLKVSGHAQTRLQSRNIELDQAQWDRVMDGVNRASERGAKESLVMVDDIALIVSVKNKTLITAVDQGSLKANVFTNIDSAVIV